MKDLELQGINHFYVEADELKRSISVNEIKYIIKNSRIFLSHKMI